MENAIKKAFGDLPDLCIFWTEDEEGVKGWLKTSKMPGYNAKRLGRVEPTYFFFDSNKEVWYDWVDQDAGSLEWYSKTPEEKQKVRLEHGRHAQTFMGCASCVDGVGPDWPAKRY